MATDRKTPHPLGRLIHEVQQANGWSYADISANARTAGRSLSRSRVESLRNDPLSSIGIKAIEALAAGLSVPPDRVAAAAVESMGYRPEPTNATPTAAAALGSDPQLSAAMRRVLIAALEAAHQEFHSTGGGAAKPAARKRQIRPSGNHIQDVAADDS